MLGSTKPVVKSFGKVVIFFGGRIWNLFTKWWWNYRVLKVGSLAMTCSKTFVMYLHICMSFFRPDVPES